LPTELPLPEGYLSRCVQQRIHGGRLPLVTCPQVNARYGTGDEDCEVCDQAIHLAQIAYEVTDDRNGNRLMFHNACYLTWQRECARRLAEYLPDQTRQ
jgi:hypothetical protein